MIFEHQISILIKPLFGKIRIFVYVNICLEPLVMARCGEVVLYAKCYLIFYPPSTLGGQICTCMYIYNKKVYGTFSYFVKNMFAKHFFIGQVN